MMYKIFSIFLLTVSLSGCVRTVVSGATAVGMSVAQERSVGNAIDDTTIMMQIQSEYIQKDVNVLFNGIEVTVNEGRVLLTGNVSVRDNRIEAVRLAWQPQGVKEVINEIQIKEKGDTYLKDTWITAQVRSKMLLNRDIRSINYTIDTVSGIVYLMGIAQDDTELDNVTQIASTVSGVEKVISHVRLKDDPNRGQ